MQGAQIIRFPASNPLVDDCHGDYHTDGDDVEVNPILLNRAVEALDDGELVCCCGSPASRDVLTRIAQTVLSSVLRGE